MDPNLLFLIPAVGVGYFAGWVCKPDAKPQSEIHARVADLELRTHHHAPAPAPVPAHPHGPHGADYIAWGHTAKDGHWRRHRDGTRETSHDGKFA